MLAFEHPQREQIFQQSYSSASNVQAPYPGLEMDAFNYAESMNNNFHPLPFSYFENPAMFTTAPAPSMKAQMTRSLSSHSTAQHYPQHSSEMAPGLVSSASSSTVGSPYSGPMHAELQHADSYNADLLSHGLGLLPTIVNQDFNSDFMGAGYDNEVPMGHDKTNGNFVGESADLSSLQKRSSTFSYPTSRAFQRSVSPVTPLSSSPELLTANGSISDPSHALTQPISYVPVNRSVSVPVSVPQQQLVEPIFKSPSTPASAYPRTPSAHSPIDSRSQTHGATSSVLLQQHLPVALQSQPMQRHGGQFQHHFFAQSSGNFMAPIETTCSFSLTPA